MQSNVMRHCTQRAAPARQPQRRPPCRARPAAPRRAAKAQQAADDLQAWPPVEPEELGEQGAGEQAAAAAQPPEIIEDFTNFTPDPPGHRAGFVAIIGRPNAGKSTLMNALLGQSLSIVTHKAQTTRHRILGILSEPHFQAVFLDTPGIIDRRNNKLEERMMAAVQQAVKDAECLLAIVDASHKAEEALAMIQPGDDWSGPPMAVLLNKTDLLSEEQLAELKDWYQANCKADAVFAISALESNGLEPVRDWIVSKLPESPSLYPKDIESYWQNPANQRTSIRRSVVHMLSGQPMQEGIAYVSSLCTWHMHGGRDAADVGVTAGSTGLLDWSGNTADYPTYPVWELPTFLHELGCEPVACASCAGAQPDPGA